MKRRTFLATAGAAIAAPVLAKGAQAAAPIEHHISIKGFRFDPPHVKVRPGDTIIWTNHDIAPHTATARDGSWDTGRLKKSEAGRLVVTSNTAPDYFCRYHRMMKARIEVVSG